MTKNTVICKRNLSVDLIKIFAMFGVMSLHTNMGRLDTYPTAFILSRIAGISIPLFFMVSGYLMLDRETNFRYSISKIIRIIRFVFIIVFIHWMLIRWFVDYPFLSMLKTFMGSFLQRGKFFVFWYFGAMCILYSILPILQKIHKNKKVRYILLGILGAISFILFELDAEMSFEKMYVPQTFRIWYWLFFFMVGGIMKEWKSSENIFPSHKFLLFNILLSATAFLFFVYWFRYKINSIEYFFGSFLCWMYSFAVFAYFITKNFKGKWVSVLSQLFLPCYAIHMMVIHTIRKFIDSSIFGLWSPLIDYILVVSLTLSISLLIMKTPIVHNIFKI